MVLDLELIKQSSIAQRQSQPLLGVFYCREVGYSLEPDFTKQPDAPTGAGVGGPMEQPDYAKIIEQDTETLKNMKIKSSRWRTVIVGLPIIRKLLNGEDVELETFKINLIPDDVLYNAREKKK
jgi:hypothetical protein